MADEKVDLTKIETKKTWKESLGAFLTKKGAVIGAALVVLGGILQGSTNWVDGVVSIIKGFFGA